MYTILQFIIVDPTQYKWTLNKVTKGKLIREHLPCKEIKEMNGEVLFCQPISKLLYIYTI